MEKVIKEYTHWSQADLPEDLRAELEAIEKDENQIYDRFCKDLNFGTSGLRGKMGVGTNRINSIVLKRATHGVMDYLFSKKDKPVVIIGYDTRINSKEYAMDIAKEMAAGGVEAKIFFEPTPVPVLSFAIPRLKADGGIMVTASHNPKEYNGYKVYDECGNQIDEQKARIIEKYINKRDYFERSQGVNRDPEKIFILGDEVKESYLKALKEHILLWGDEDEAKKALSALSVVYTPLNGVGRDYVMEVMRTLNIYRFKVVKEQSLWDGRFPTCQSPNPEYEESFELAIDKYCDDNTDIIISTDPDSDRMGVMARCNGNFKRLTGNQVGVLMLDYVCCCGRHSGTIGPDKIAYKSYVSSPFAEEIARHYGVQIQNVPVGFKNIAVQIEKLKSLGREKDFLFGFEESLGYLYGNYTRDKDGVLATQMICLMAACLKSKGRTLFDRLEELHKEHGYAISRTSSIEFNSEADRKKTDNLMEDLFAGKMESLMGQPLEHDLNYKDINMFKGTLRGGHQIIIRPSGTEMKIKIYAYAKGSSNKEAEMKVESLISEARNFVEDYCRA